MLWLCLFLQGDIVQKVLRIFLEYSESTSDLLDELACSILPQVCDFHEDTSALRTINETW